MNEKRMMSDQLMNNMLKLVVESMFDSQLPHALILVENEIISRRGYKDGRTAGSWVFDGNTPEEDVKRLQRGIEEGDPQYLDMLPQPQVSGEFADSPTFHDILLDELNWPLGVEYERDDTGELYNVYCEAFDTGVHDEVMSFFGESVKA